MIPKIIHQIWVGNNPLPRNYICYRQSWIKNHPEWSYMVWTDDTLKALKDFDYHFYNKCWCEAMKADVLRLYIIYQFGGIYADADFECNQPLDELLDADFFCGTGWNGSTIYYNGIFGSVAGHPLLRAMIDDLPSRFRRFNTVFYITGPGLFADHIKKFGASNIIAHPESYFYSQPYVYARHYWVDSWGNTRKKPQIKMI